MMRRSSGARAWAASPESGYGRPRPARLTAPVAPPPRLRRRARSVRAALAASVALGVGTALLLVAQAWLLAGAIARGFAGEPLGAAPAALLAVVVAAPAAAWVAEPVAAGCSARVKAELRPALLERAAR